MRRKLSTLPEQVHNSMLPNDGPACPTILHRLSVPMTRVRRGSDVRLIVGDGNDIMQTPADPALVKLIATARDAWSAMLVAGDTSLDDVAKAQGYSSDYFTHLLRLATL